MMVVRVPSSSSPVVQPDARVEHRERDHGLGEKHALGYEPCDAVARDGASQAAPGGGGAVGAAREDARAGEGEHGEEGLEAGGEGRASCYSCRCCWTVALNPSVAPGAGGRVVSVPPPVGAAGARVGDGQEDQGAGEGEGLQEEPREDEGLARVALGGEEEAPGPGAAGAREGEAEAGALQEEGGEVGADEEMEVEVGGERRVLCTEDGEDLGCAEVEAG